MKNHTMMIICNKDVKTERSTHRCLITSIGHLQQQNEGNTSNMLDKKKGRKDPSCNFYVGLAQINGTLPYMKLSTH